jgi:hypothetical protein
MTMQKHQRGVVAWLREAGAADVRVEQPSARGHPRIVSRWQGEERFYVVPSSPGDVMRGEVNAIADLRRILGLVSHERRVGERRPRKVKRRRSGPVLAPVALSVGPVDWRDVLGALKGSGWWT